VRGSGRVECLPQYEEEPKLPAIDRKINAWSSNVIWKRVLKLNFSHPISDVFTHHRALKTCHLSNIAMRLNRLLTWDAKTEQILGDDDANNWQRRQPREGYEIDA
jgi:hypothetical protein